MCRPTRERRSFLTERKGQGLIEFALTVPVLLLLLLGIVDLGRGFYYSIGISNAARGAAFSASHDPAGSISLAAVRQRACDETGWVQFGDTSACRGLAALTVSCVPNDPTVAARDPKVSVTVTYRWRLVSFFLAPFIGDPATTSVLVTYELTNETETPCTAP